MPSKPFKYNELSNKTCKKCGKRLKLNLIAKAPHANFCYACKKGIVKYKIISERRYDE